VVVLLIEDLARSVAFYRRLGVVFPDDVDQRKDVVVDNGGGHNLVLTTTFVRNDPDRREPSGGARTFLEFFVDGDEAVNATYDELVAAGYRSRRAPVPDGLRRLDGAGRRPGRQHGPRHGR
jgi:catechol 2,3-dioxygenase-like lactoylglutathione lyase family enzyme